MARVFLSYSRRDQEFVDQLAAGLAERGVEVTRDTANLMAAAEWRKQLEDMISAADTVVFVVSPDSIASPECTWEVNLVERFSKRMAPIIWRPVENDRIPQGISKLQYVDFSGGREFGPALTTLVTAIDTDMDWLAGHTRLGEMSRRWDEEGRSRSGVLRGGELDAAERWLNQQPKAAPQPAALHREFIAASRRAATQRLRNWIVGSIAVTVVSVGLAVAAYFARVEAIAQAEEAVKQETAAVAAQKLAQENESKAVKAQLQAQEAQKLEVQQRRLAEDNLAGQSKLLAQISEDQTRAGNSAIAINLARKALPRDLSSPDRRVVDDALVSLFYAVDQDRRLMTLAGHGNGVMYACYNADGTRILTASSDKTARLWDARTGELIREMFGAEDAVMHAAFSPDGNLVATTSGAITRIWDGRTGRPRFLLQGHTKNVQRIAFSPNGERIVTGAWDNTARIWDASSGEQIHVLHGAQWSRENAAAGSGTADPIMAAVMHAQTQIFGGMDVVAISPDGHFVATGGRADPEGVVRLWNIDSGKLERVLRGPTLSLSQSFLDLSFSYDGSRLAAALGDNTARVWNVATGDQILVLKDHTNSVNTVRFSHDGKRILTGAMDGSARIWDATSGKTLVAIHGHRDWVNSAEFSPDDRLVVTASSDKGLKLWDAVTGALVANLTGHQERVLGASFSPDGKHLLSASRDKTASVWLVEIGSSAAKLEQPEPDKDSESRYVSERKLLTSPDGRRVFLSSTSSIDRSGSLVDARTGIVIAEVDGQSGVFAGDGRSLLTFSSEFGGLRTWSTEDGRLLHSFPGIGMAIDPGRQLLVTRSGPALSISDLGTGREIARMNSDGEIVSAALSTDGARVVIASDTELTLWQVEGSRKIAQLAGLDGKPVRIRIAPGDAHVSTVSDSGSVGLWSMSDGRPIKLARDAREEFTRVEFSADGRLLRGIRRDKGFKLWRSADGGSVISLSRQPLPGAERVINGMMQLESDDDDDSETGPFIPNRFAKLPSSTSFGASQDDIPSAFAGNRLVMLTEEGEIWRVDASGVTKLKLSEVQPVCADNLSQSSIGPARRHLVVRSQKATCLIDIANGSAVALEGDHQPSYSPRRLFDAAENVLLEAGAAFDGIWDTATGKLIARLPKPPTEEGMWSREDDDQLAIDRSGERVLAIRSGVAHLWDSTKGKEIRTLMPRGKPVAKVRFLDEGGLALTTQADGELVFWRASDGAKVATIAHPDAVRADADSHRISTETGPEARLVGGNDLVLGGSGKLWDAKTGKLVETDVLDADRLGRRLLVRKKKKDGSSFSDEGSTFRVIEWPSRRSLVEVTEEARAPSWSRDVDKGPWVDIEGQRIAVADADRRIRLWSVRDAKLTTTLEKHNAPITSIAFDPASGRMASAAGDKVIRIWESSASEKASHTIDDLKSVPTRIVFAAGGKRLVAMLDTGTLAVWETTTWSSIELAPSQMKSSGKFKLSADGARLMMYDDDRTAVWRTSDGKLLADIEATSYGSAEFSPAGNLIIAGYDDRRTAYDLVRGAVTPLSEGEYVLAASVKHLTIADKDGKVRLLSIGDGGAGTALLDLSSPAASVQFSREGDQFALTLKSGELALGETAAPGRLRILNLPISSVDATFSADGKQIAVRGASSTALLVDTTSGGVVHRFSGHAGPVDRISFSNDGNYVLTKTGGNWFIWDRVSGQRIGQAKSDSYGDEVTFVATSAGLRVIVPSYSAPQLWDAAGSSRLAELKPPAVVEEEDREPAERRLSSSRDDLVRTALAPDGAFLMVTRGDELQCWDAQAGTKAASSSAGVSSIDSMTAVGERRAVAMLEGGMATLWDMAGCKPLAEIKHVLSAIGGIVASPIGETFLTVTPTSSSSREVPQDPVVWDVATGKRLAQLEGHTSRPEIVKYAPDGKHVLTVPPNGLTWLWRASDGKFLRTLGRHNEAVSSVSFSRDGRLLASAASDGSVDITVVETGRSLASIRSSGERVSGLAFSRDGRRLAIGRAGGGFAVLDIASQRTLIERKIPGSQLRQVLLASDHDDIVTLNVDGSGELFRLAPSGFAVRPTWQELIDYASIREMTDVDSETVEADKPARARLEEVSSAQACDSLASDPYDPQRAAPPVTTKQIDATAAIETCTKAVAENGSISRLHHQLGRALLAADRKDEAERSFRRAAADGFAPSQLALAVRLLASEANGTEGEADRLLNAAAQAGNGEALNFAGLRLWQKASDDSERKRAAAMMRRGAESNSAMAHENLAVILSGWPNDKEASAARLYHLLQAAKLHAAEGSKVRSAALLVRAQALSRMVEYSVAAAAARRVRIEVDAR